MTTTTYRIEWRDLADSELRVRLESRGFTPEEARIIVSQRERAAGAQLIEAVLRP